MRPQLSAEPEQLEGPGQVRLTWAADGATTVLLSDVGRLEGARGSTSVALTATTTFILTAFDAGRGRVACAQATVTVAERMAAGIIVPWWGDGRAPPDGWVVCDGRNGTPDLRGRFVAGAGTAAPPAGDRGTHSHALDLQDLGALATEAAGEHGHPSSPATGHFHRKHGGRTAVKVSAGADPAWGAAGGHAHALEAALPASAPSAAPDPLPPWHALHYLMQT